MVTPDNAFEYTSGGQYIERQVSADISFTLPTFSTGFEWHADYYQTIADVAATNRVDDWPLLKDIMKYKLSESIKTYLSNGPPNPLSPAEAYEIQTRACASLDEFKTYPPFTIQRLAELIHTPEQHYSSLPKYLRALTRAISVTSDQKAFTEEDSINPFASTSHLEDPAIAGMGLHPNSPHTPTTRPPAIRSRSNSNSNSITALLSPIPWLVTARENVFSPPADVIPTTESPSTNGNGNYSGNYPLEHQTSPSSLTNTVTGGVVDELDPGSGSSELADEPVAITHLSPSREDGMETASLAERFERARSPRVDSEVETAQPFALEP